MDLSNLKTDTALTEDGAWIDIDTTTRIKVARYGNKKFKERLRRLMKPYSRMIDQGTMPDDKADELLVDAMANSILLDWEGLELNGEKVQYSIDQAKAFLSDPELQDFRELVVSLSNDLEAFRQKEIETTVEKSAST